METSKRKNRIPLSSISDALENGLSGIDAERKKSLERLKRVRNAKISGLEREQKRLSVKLGTNHPRTVGLTSKTKVNRELVRNLGIEIDHAGTDVPTVDENSWVLHGYVRDKESRGVSGLTLSLYNQKGEWIELLGYACTTQTGYFRLSHSIRSEGKGDLPQGFIRVHGKDKVCLHSDKRCVTPGMGRVDYREIYLTGEDVVCRPPGPAGGVVPPTMPGSDVWIVRGRVTDESGKAFDGVTISLYDKDLLFDDVLGVTVTDANGDFQVIYRTEGFRDLFEKQPDIYLKVLDRGGKTLYSSRKGVRCEAGRVEEFQITIKRQ